MTAGWTSVHALEMTFGSLGWAPEITHAAHYVVMSADVLLAVLEFFLEVAVFQ